MSAWTVSPSRSTTAWADEIACSVACAASLTCALPVAVSFVAAVIPASEVEMSSSAEACCSAPLATLRLASDTRTAASAASAADRCRSSNIGHIRCTARCVNTQPTIGVSVMSSATTAAIRCVACDRA
jgi:hypothetical protein